MRLSTTDRNRRSGETSVSRSAPADSMSATSCASFFGSVIRSGRVTTSFRRGLSQIYHIESADHTWYRGIIEANIITKLEPQ